MLPTKCWDAAQKSSLQAALREDKEQPRSVSRGEWASGQLVAATGPERHQGAEWEKGQECRK